MKMRHRIAGLAAATALTSSMLLPLATAQAAGDFYTVPSQLPQQNGALVKQEPSAFYLEPLKLTPVPAEVRRVMYKSTNTLGQAMAVTGTVMMPRTPWLGVNASQPWKLSQRPLVVLSPGTKGNGDQCAPSKRLATGEDYEGAIVKGLLTAGYAVAIPDYEGVGTSLPATYMARVATGNAVLDVARAAQKTGFAGLSSSTPVMLAGYSQGGEATAAASELAGSYAPELKILGAYAGSVPANLIEVAKFLDSGLYNAFLMSAVSGLTNAYNIDVSEYANAAGMAALEKNNALCTMAEIPQAAFRDTSKYTKSGQKLSALITSVPELRKIAEEQTIGRAAPKNFPVLVAQSELDDVIPAPQARNFARQWCQGGATVQYLPWCRPTSPRRSDSNLRCSAS